MNSVFSNSGDIVDTNAVFTKLKEYFPKVKEVESITVLKEFTELAYNDDEMNVKFGFITPHTIKMIYRGNEWVGIDDEEFAIILGNKTEEEVIVDYICYLDYYWKRYIAADLSGKKMTQELIEEIEIIKSKVKKIW